MSDEEEEDRDPSWIRRHFPAEAPPKYQPRTPQETYPEYFYEDGSDRDPSWIRRHFPGEQPEKYQPRTPQETYPEYFYPDGSDRDPSWIRRHFPGEQPEKYHVPNPGIVPWQQRHGIYGWRSEQKRKAFFPTTYEALLTSRGQGPYRWWEDSGGGGLSAEFDEVLNLPSWILKLTPYRAVPPQDGDEVLCIDLGVWVILGKVVAAGLGGDEGGDEGGGEGGG